MRELLLSELVYCTGSNAREIGQLALEHHEPA